MTKPSTSRRTKYRGSLPRRVRIRQLWVGDRFEVYGSLWTYNGASGDGTWATARKHSFESIALGERGHGYIGDAICSFKLTDWVRFVPVSNPNVDR
jgi:hypothetical protein